MNNIYKVSFAGLFLASSSLFAVEPALGWYGGLFVGPSFASGTDVTISRITPADPFFVFRPSISYNILVNLGAQVGYRCNKLRYEVELLYDVNTISKISRVPPDLDGVTISDTNVKGQTWALGGLFNAYYEFYDLDYSETRWVPYVGLGIGYAQVNSSLDYQLAATPIIPGLTGATLQVNTVENTPIGQGIIGASYFMSDTSSIATDFRYYTSKLNIKNTHHTNFNSRVSGFSLNFVFNYTFDQTNY